MAKYPKMVGSRFKYKIFDDEDLDVVKPVNPELVAQEADVVPTPDVYNQYQTADILIERQGLPMRGTVMQHARNHEGELVGVANRNPLLDSREYEIQYPDSTVDNRRVIVFSR